ncbi:hypothetical protein GGI25_004284 [Coemansia spiralis]|uniref:WD40 repeat-like protein n=2 Tax=Coemansia TaxID=4863 RepID=A0A9W8G0Q1_9FUNG|nr:hypothetical protein BX070DRAFT_252613 [Coemansia spiralis]KAJ1990472.1 hypothetical protein EDC05_004012 [Coemansia umbellata]KAJ2620778.1 hypothetical protein GGI26_004673 [Coemansia sp. RSA 1358]KAJ2674632.1 hypothetical protein GGI25_004284 [Coemansia spiralis]
MTGQNSKRLKRSRASASEETPSRSTTRRRRGQRQGDPANNNGSEGIEPNAGQQLVGTTAPSAAPPALPGFVWDEERQRYFPAVSRAANRQEQQEQERERSRMQTIAEARMREKKRRMQQHSSWSIPSTVRQRSTALTSAGLRWSGTQSTEATRLRFAPLKRYMHEVSVSAPPAIVTSICTFPLDRERTTDYGTRVVVIGRRSGGINIVTVADDRFTEDELTGLETDGEVTSIQHITKDRYFYTDIGEGFGGSMSVASTMHGKLSTLGFPNHSVFCASKLPTVDSVLHMVTAVGLSNSVVTVEVAPTGFVGAFGASTSSDILSTSFLGGNPKVFVGGGRDGRVRLFDTRVSGKRHDKRFGLMSEHSSIKRHDSSVHGIGADRWFVVSTSMDGRSRVSDIRMPNNDYHWLNDPQIAEHRPVSTHVWNLHIPSLLPAASRRLGFDIKFGVAAIAGSDADVRLWDVRKGEMLTNIGENPWDHGSCAAVCLDWDSPTAHPWLITGCSSSVMASCNGLNEPWDDFFDEDKDAEERSHADSLIGGYSESGEAE